MSENKVVSLDQFRKQKEQTQETVSKSNSSPEGLNYDGTLVWLHCPTCNTYEYTEVRAPYGRSHKCGTQIVEEEVWIDLRAELTITLINIGKMQEMRSQTKGSVFKKLFSKQVNGLLDQVEQAEMIYLDRIKKAAVVKIEPYVVESEEDLKALPILETTQLGLYVSEFRYQPEKRFQESLK